MIGLTGKEIGEIIHKHNLSKGYPVDDTNLRVVQEWWEENIGFLEECGLIVVTKGRET